MRKDELKAAWQKAKDPEFARELGDHMSEHGMKSYWNNYVEWAVGLAVDGVKRFATIEQVAAVIRYQCVQLNGGWDMVEWESLMGLLNKRVTCLG